MNYLQSEEERGNPVAGEVKKKNVYEPYITPYLTRIIICGLET